MVTVRLETRNFSFDSLPRHVGRGEASRPPASGRYSLGQDGGEGRVRESAFKYRAASSAPPGGERDRSSFLRGDPSGLVRPPDAPQRFRIFGRIC